MSKKKRIDEILWQAVCEIDQQYGMRDHVFKITVSHELFDAMVFDMASNKLGHAAFVPSSMNDFTLCGVRVEARSKPSD